jgi:hypothetical protein
LGVRGFVALHPGEMSRCSKSMWNLNQVCAPAAVAYSER